MNTAVKVPVTFLDGHSPWQDLLGVISTADMARGNFCRFFTCNQRKWGRLQPDFYFDCTSITYLIDATRDYKAWWLLGKNGEAVEVRAGVATLEQIEGAGLNMMQPYGYLSAIKNIQGELYACGYGRQVYRREESQWISIADGILTREPARGFFDIDGASRSSLYAVGWDGEIYFHDGQAWRQDDSHTTEHLASVRCLGKDDVWVAGDNGVVLHGSFNQWQIIRDDAFTDNWYCIEEFNGRMYLAGHGQLAYVDGEAIRAVDVGLGRDITTHRLHARDGRLWSIGEKDILVFDGKAWQAVPHPDND
jgi:hypothetical protein